MWFPMCMFFLFMMTLNAKEIPRNINGGTILGTSDVTEGLKKEYYAFKGIPFAEPPRRFELPVPKKPWNGVLNCTYDKDQCIQNDGFSTTVSGSEDCLFLSVYTTNLTASASVLVFVHGGGFTFGNASYSPYAPDYLLDEDLVVVLIQYRMGIFGFMSTGDEVCPGNLGLKDQVLALQWVKNQIHYFGGNPSDVTIMGQSAGSGSVSLHMNSPKSKGLFKGVIMNSGVSLCSWDLNRRAVVTAYSVGITLGIITNNSTVLVNELKKVESKKLQGISFTVALLITLENFVETVLLYGPVKEVEHETAFFTGKSEKMLSTGNFTKVPVLAGITSNEGGTLITPDLLVPARIYFARYDIFSMDVVPFDLTTSSFNKTFAGLEIKHEFFGDYLSTFTFAPVGAVTKFLNVDLLARPVNKFIMDVSKYVSDTYYYMFSYVGDFRKNMSTPYEGVSHAEDLYYLFRNGLPFSTKDQLARKRMVRLWANFCKFSKPIPGPDPLLQNSSWLPASSSQPPFLMNINSTLGKTAHIYQKHLDFYEGLYARWGQGEYDTY